MALIDAVDADAAAESLAVLAYSMALDDSTFIAERAS